MLLMNHMNVAGALVMQEHRKQASKASAKAKTTGFTPAHILKAF